MKQKYETFDNLVQDYIDNKISYDEYVEQICILYVGEDNYDYYDLAEHDLYIYCADDTVMVVENFY